MRGAMPLRVLVVDDSVFNRRSIGEILAQSPEIEVVGKAADGEEALRLVANLKPDCITLDLEMPRMDGFTFLRILMTKMPTPVIVVSSYSQKENVFKALELGALDFVAKPDRYSDPDLGAIRDELVRKVMLASHARRGAIEHDRTGGADRPHCAEARGRDCLFDRWPQRADGDFRALSRGVFAWRRDRSAHAGQVHAHVRRALGQA